MKIYVILDTALYSYSLLQKYNNTFTPYMDRARNQWSLASPNARFLASPIIQNPFTKVSAPSYNFTPASETTDNPRWPQWSLVKWIITRCRKSHTMKNGEQNPSKRRKASYRMVCLAAIDLVKLNPSTGIHSTTSPRSMITTTSTTSLAHPSFKTTLAHP